MSLLPMATTAAPAALSVPIFPLRVIVPLLLAPIVRFPRAVPPISESITVDPVPLRIVSASAVPSVCVASIVDEKSMFPAPVPLLIVMV